MHGRLKVRSSEEEKIRKDQERTKKVLLYKMGMQKIVEKRTNKEYDNEALAMTSQLLSANPDISTLWNYRREILLDMMKIEERDKLSALFDGELQLTEYCLKVNPKSYCAWHQRVWVLDTRDEPDWGKELKLCNAYLKLDERNFHCWDYRRHIVSCSNIPLEKEFDFSTEKIHENFSNYSAWHYRSKLLTKLFPDKEGFRSIEELQHRDELELVINAAFTDPNDTSAWFYQRWLLGAIPKNLNLAVCTVTSDKSFVAFNRSVALTSANSSITVTIEVDGQQIKGKWKAASDYAHDFLWLFEYNHLALKKENHVIVNLVCDSKTKDSLNCTHSESDNEYIGYMPINFESNLGIPVIEELKKQQDSCEQLLELEPESKWTHLTLAIIKKSIDHINNYKDCNNILNRLIDLDPNRKNYYRDLSSKWHIEYFLQNHCELVRKGRFTISPGHDDDLKLSTLYHLQHWSGCPHVNLSGHELTTQSLPSLRVLQNCQVLNLSNNCLSSLQGFPYLPKLHTLYIGGNHLMSLDELTQNKNVCSIKNIVTSQDS